MKRFLIGLLIFIIVLGCFGAAGFFGLGFWLSPQSSLTKSDAIVAISGGETTSRAEEAVRLYKEGWAPLVIFSGAAQDPTGPSNARAMEMLAISEGIPQQAIVLDEASNNTTENAAGVDVILKQRSINKIILVTSPYHQRRADITFARADQNLVILNHSTIDHNWRRTKWWATAYSRSLTFAELQKTLYVLITNRISS